ncbi:MAG: ABC transporter permease [Holophagales bacterium]|nr:ABC transporter permease [Holophagales bacterium]
MDTRELFQSAFRSLKENKLRSALTVIGIVIGVSAVIATVSLINGLRGAVLASMEKFGSNLLEVSPVNSWDLSYEEYKKIKKNELTFDDMHELSRELPHVLIDITPVLGAGRENIFYRGRGTSTSPYMSDETWLDNNKFELAQGRNFVPADLRLKSKVAIIGSLLIKRLEISGNPIGQSILYRNVNFEIVGVFGDLGSNVLYDSNDLMMIPITTGILMHPEEKDRLSFIAHYVTTMDADYVEDIVADTLRRIKGLKSNDVAGFKVATMKRHTKQLYSIMAAVAGIASGMLGISIIVGGVGIMNIMLVSVTERTREIGVRKAVGAKRSHILAQFLIEASVLCLFGGAIGMLLGYLAGMTASKIIFNQTPWIPMSAFIIGFGVPTAIGILFGYYPAAKASKFDPIEALRYE